MQTAPAPLPKIARIRNEEVAQPNKSEFFDALKLKVL